MGSLTTSRLAGVLGRVPVERKYHRRTPLLLAEAWVAARIVASLALARMSITSSVQGGTWTAQLAFSKILKCTCGQHVASTPNIPAVHVACCAVRIKYQSTWTSDRCRE